MATATVRKIRVPGTELHVQEAGEGRPLVFVHGMCGNADAWAGQFERLTGEFRCIAYDRRGHTRSPFGDAGQRTVSLHGNDCVALVEALGLESPVYVGSSGGARIGVDVIVRHGDTFAGAVLSEPPVVSLARDGGASLREAVGPPVQSAPTPEDAVDAFFTVVCPGLWSDLPDERKDAYRANHIELFGDLSMPPMAVTPEDLRHVQVPVRLIGGDQSLPVFGEIVRELADLLPRVDVVTLRGSGHVTYYERPDEFANAVRTFVRSL
jgi:3-oxoadipate enol-lactonase